MAALLGIHFMAYLQLSTNKSASTIIWVPPKAKETEKETEKVVKETEKVSTGTKCAAAVLENVICSEGG